MANEEFFERAKQLMGSPEHVQSFCRLENYIRWKGKEDPGKFYGKSMLRRFEVIVEMYRLMWIIVVESWMAIEEEYEYCADLSSRRDLIKEFDIYQSFKEFYLTKMERLVKLEEKKKAAFEFEQDFTDILSDSKMLSRAQARVFGGNIAQPS